MNHPLTYLLALSAVALFALVFWVPRSRWLEDRGSTNAEVVFQAPPAGDTNTGHGPDDTAEGDENDESEDADTESQDDDPDDDALGDPGKKALDRMKAQRNKFRDELAALKAAGGDVNAAKALKTSLAAANADELKTLRQQVAELTAKAEGREAEYAAEQAKREAESEALAKANGRILRSEVRAAAAGKLTDPADALLYLDLTQFEVDDDGNVDTEELSDAIDELLRTKPYLSVSAQGGNSRFKGGADGGTRKGSKPPTLDEQIVAAQKDGNARLVISLQNQKLAELTGSS